MPVLSRAPMLAAPNTPANPIFRTPTGGTAKGRRAQRHAVPLYRAQRHAVPLYRAQRHAVPNGGARRDTVPRRAA